MYHGFLQHKTERLTSLLLVLISWACFLCGIRHMNPILLTWSNLNANMDNQLHLWYSVGWNDTLKLIIMSSILNLACDYLSMLGLQSVHVGKRVQVLLSRSQRANCHMISRRIEVVQFMPMTALNVTCFLSALLLSKVFGILSTDLNVLTSNHMTSRQHMMIYPFA